MQRAKGAGSLRRSLAIQARLLFWAPRGVRRDWSSLGPRPALTLTPRLARPERVILYFHGGAFIFGSPMTHAALVAQLANRVGARAVLPQYRLAPEHPFPAAFDDAVAAWQALQAQGIPAAHIVLGGDSAGGCLALALLAHLVAQKEALPGAVFAFSPLTDMTHSGESFALNAEAEAVLAAGRAHELGQMYLAGHDPKDHRVSPLNADFSGASPVWLCAGDTEILRDDAFCMARRLEAQGVEVALRREGDLPHVWPIFHNFLPEARATLDDLAQWLRQRQGWSGES